MPLLFCLKNIGPGDSSFIKRPKSGTRIGNVVRMTKDEKTISKARFESLFILISRGSLASDTTGVSPL